MLTRRTDGGHDRGREADADGSDRSAPVSLALVTKLGPYEILSPIGAGGMGEVYRAKDTRLDREVAIKVLPDALSRDPERLQRFQREAKVLASLNHPNIAAIYGFEEVDGKAFLVMELAEGETLAKRIKNGPLPIDDALAVGKQIAEALEAAHEKGIIHRDLKPENVKITPAGKVKVLDFGLAKAVAPADEQSRSRLLNSPTITVGHSPTVAGVILGTAAYMSPEQARGKPLDKRTDIWSFGVVLHETLTGQRVFAGETISDSIGAILHKEPDWATLPSEMPPTIQLLLRRCLTKEPSKRLRDIGDARIELENAIADPTSSSLGLAHAVVAAESVRGHRRTRGAFSTVAALVVVAAIAAVTGWSLRPDPEAPVRKFSITPEDYEPSRGIAMSPDGRKIVYVAANHLWVREIDRLEPRELPGTDNATQPVWSPDGSQIAYATENKLWQIPSRGGTPTTIGTLPSAMLSVGGLSWLRDGRIMIATGNTGLHEVSARGGEIRTILDVDPATEEDFHHAAALPGGRGVLFTIHRKGGGPDQIDLWTPTGRKTLLEIEGERFDDPIYSPTGHILYARSTTTPGLWALPFSLSDLDVTGEPFLVASDAGRPSVSRDGTPGLDRSEGRSDRHGWTAPARARSSAALTRRRAGCRRGPGARLTQHLDSRHRPRNQDTAYVWAFRPLPPGLDPGQGRRSVQHRRGGPRFCLDETSGRRRRGDGLGNP
jgi:serine/threonine protein kinase